MYRRIASCGHSLIENEFSFKYVVRCKKWVDFCDFFRPFWLQLHHQGSFRSSYSCFNTVSFWHGMSCNGYNINLKRLYCSHHNDANEQISISSLIGLFFDHCLDLLRKFVNFFHGRLESTIVIRVVPLSKNCFRSFSPHFNKLRR